LFIHRPEKYGFIEDEEGNSLRGVAEIIVAKHRNGALGDVRLRFKDEFAKFVDLEELEPFMLDSAVQSVTFGSKMNEEPSGAPFNIGGNKAFDKETPF
jgi:replicative DNA helicase